jgi:hypothetical protein
LIASHHDSDQSSDTNQNKPNYIKYREVDHILSNPEKTSKNRIILIEIGTGDIIGEIKNIFDISTVCVSKKGDFIILGSQKGQIGVWAVNEVIYNNISEVLAEMKINPRF